MFNQCRDYLIEKLKVAGVKREIHIAQKTLDADNESHKAAVIGHKDEVERSGDKTTFRDREGNKHKRTKVFTRKLTFIVTIGGYSEGEVDKIYEAFLAIIGTGLDINGNWTELSLEPADWVDEKDDIIRSKVALIFQVVFKGGVYKDTDYLKVGLDLDLESEMERKK